MNGGHVSGYNLEAFFIGPSIYSLRTYFRCIFMWCRRRLNKCLLSRVYEYIFRLKLKQNSKQGFEANRVLKKSLEFAYTVVHVPRSFERSFPIFLQSWRENVIPRLAHVPS